MVYCPIWLSSLPNIKLLLPMWAVIPLYFWHWELTKIKLMILQFPACTDYFCLKINITDTFQTVMSWGLAPKVWEGVDWYLVDTTLDTIISTVAPPYPKLYIKCPNIHGVWPWITCKWSMIRHHVYLKVTSQVWSNYAILGMLPFSTDISRVQGESLVRG